MIKHRPSTDTQYAMLTSLSRRSFSAALVGVALAPRSASAETVTYTYDELGRIKTATYGNGQTVTYDYDAAGNRVTLNQSQPTTINGSLTASPGAIAPGGSATLSWASNIATGASISNGVGAVAPVAGGSVAVTPAATTTYILTLTGTGGPITRQATVVVA